MEKDLIPHPLFRDGCPSSYSTRGDILTERKVCPICDSPLPPGAKRCPVCNADLSLFEDVSMAEDFDIESPDTDIKIENESLDNLLGTIVSEMKEGAEEAQVTEQFECPICGAMVDIDADVCPNCGAVFVEEEEEFECPVCGALVDADATFCPKCGAKFVEEEAEPEAPEEGEAQAPSQPEFPEETETEPLEAEETGELPSQVEEKEEEVRPEPAAAETSGQPGFPEKIEPPLKEAETAEETKEIREEESQFLKRMRDLRKEGEKEPSAVEAAGPAGPEPETERPAPVSAAPPEEKKLSTRDKYRKLPVLVSKVKPLLIIARQNNINVKKGKELIDRAVAAGRNRQIDEAINYISESRKLLEESLSIYANHDISEIETDMPNLKAPEEVKDKLMGVIREAKSSLQEGNFDRAFQRLEIARRVLKDHRGDFQEARRMLTELENTVMDAEYFFVDVSRPKEMLENAKESAEKGDWNTAGIFAREGLELMDTILPEIIKKEMKKARNILLEAKMQGRDISKGISILKHASIASKSGNSGDALKYIKLFKAEMNR